MPWEKVQKYECSRCGKQQTIGYVNPTSRRHQGTLCQTCVSELRAERKAAAKAEAETNAAEWEARKAAKQHEAITTGLTSESAPDKEPPKPRKRAAAKRSSSSKPAAGKRTARSRSKGAAKAAA